MSLHASEWKGWEGGIFQVRWSLNDENEKIFKTFLHRNASWLCDTFYSDFSIIVKPRNVPIGRWNNRDSLCVCKKYLLANTCHMPHDRRIKNIGKNAVATANKEISPVAALSPMFQK